MSTRICNWSYGYYDRPCEEPLGHTGPCRGKYGSNSSVSGVWEEKPWEQDWHVAFGDKFCADRGHVAGIYKGKWEHDEVVTTDRGVYGPTIAEAKLIAQAPAMARLLLEMHERGSFDGCHDESAVADVLRGAGVLP